MKAIAVHTVHYRWQDQRRIARPGDLIEISEVDFEDIARFGAVRAAEEPKAAAKPDPLDHDGDGRKGGSKPRKKKVAPPVEEPVADEGQTDLFQGTPSEPSEGDLLG